MPVLTTPLRAVVEAALAEDAPAGDVTTAAVVPEAARCTARLVAKAAGVVAGIEAAAAVFEVAAEQDGLGEVAVAPRPADGDRVAPGDVLAVVAGPARTILRAERVALNLLAHLSGVATLTRAFVDAAAPAAVLCTRKTTPGLRRLEREAVLAGGGRLHRESLSAAVLVKDNHIRLARSVGAAVVRASGTGLPVQVEVETVGELDEAIAAGADRVLLDNPTPELVRQVVARVPDPHMVEVSGGVTLESVGGLVAAGARLVSVGRLTHSAPALDVSLEVIDAA